MKVYLVELFIGEGFVFQEAYSTMRKAEKARKRLWNDPYYEDKNVTVNITTLIVDKQEAK